MNTIDINTVNAAAINANAAQQLQSMQSTSSALVPIYTVPTATPPGMFALEKRARSTEKNPVEASQRYRVAFIPESLRLIDAGAMPSKFASLVQATIDGIAQERFAAMLAEDGMSLAAIDPKAFSVDALLMYWAEQRDRQRITKESLLSWLEGSATFASLSEKAKQLWRSRIPGILAPLYRNAFTVNEATNIVAKIADSDLSDPHAVMLANRLQIIIAGGGIEAEF